MTQRWGVSRGRRTVVKVVGGQVALSYGQPDGTIQYLEGQIARLDDLTEPLDRYGRYLVEEHVPNQFASQGTPKRWESLKAAYRKQKERKCPGQPILVCTGAMKAGFRRKAFKRSLRIINRVRSGQKSGVPRWHYHQTGTSKMPARPMMQSTEKDLERLTGYVFERLED